jgi:hypothetical protein
MSGLSQQHVVKRIFVGSQFKFFIGINLEIQGLQPSGNEVGDREGTKAQLARKHFLLQFDQTHRREINLITLKQRDGSITDPLRLG